MRPETTGTFAFRSWRLWYTTIGDLHGARPPLVCVPGGPGVPHQAQTPIARALPADRAIVMYDPSGSGRSDHPEDVAWDLDLFVEELVTLRAALGLDRVHLLGSSFGGLVCLVYALTRPHGVASMVLTGTTSSMPASREAILRQIDAMPPAQRDALRGRRGTVDYLRAYYQWVAQHMCRVPLPKELNEAMARCNLAAMKRMKGPDAIGFGGTLSDLDVTDRLHELAVPTLLTCGRHDALYPEVIEKMHREIPGSRMIVFEHSSHMPQYEEPAAFVRALLEFVGEHDGDA